ncbi:hypothetical protein LFZ18_06900 [Salmonella enterica subsp. enterica serovar Itami str. SA20014991]|nr:hypothetical protein LFZ18_06900 [Salmonella enterica subsp. enterica serovar Itami str. SA20014991]
MSRKKYDANLPRNLTYRKASKSFFWRNPVTDKEFPLGQIARRDAITQAIEANNFIAQNHTPVALIEKLKINILRHSRRFFRCACKALLPAAP